MKENERAETAAAINEILEAFAPEAKAIRERQRVMTDPCPKALSPVECRYDYAVEEKMTQIQKYLNQAFEFIPAQQTLYCGLLLGYHFFLISERDHAANEVLQDFFDRIMNCVKKWIPGSISKQVDAEYEWMDILEQIHTKEEAARHLQEKREQLLGDMITPEGLTFIQRGEWAEGMTRLLFGGLQIMHDAIWQFSNNFPWKSARVVADAVFENLYRAPDDEKERIPLIAAAKYIFDRKSYPEKNIVAYVSPSGNGDGFVDLAKRFFTYLKKPSCLAILDYGVVIRLNPGPIEKLAAQAERYALNVDLESPPENEFDEMDDGNTVYHLIKWEIMKAYQTPDDPRRVDDRNEEACWDIMRACGSGFVQGIFYKAEDDARFNGKA